MLFFDSVLGPVFIAAQCIFQRDMIRTIFITLQQWYIIK